MTDYPQDYWQTYRFIDDPPMEAAEQPEGVAIAKTEDITQWDHIGRTYEQHQWYYIVFAPYNKAYEKDKAWFEYKAVDSARKWCQKKTSAYYITREIDAEKIHSNILCVSRENLYEKYHGKSCYNKYRMHVTLLQNMGDRQRVLNYITKENKKRPFKLYLDYIHST